MCKLSRICAALLAAALIAPLQAQTSSPTASASALGTSQPNLPDVSLSPNWHVYVLHDTVQGVTYVQVNDLQGNVRLIEALASGGVLVLPIGSDSGKVSNVYSVARSGTPELVYQDAYTQLYYVGAPSVSTIAGPVHVQPMSASKVRTMDTADGSGDPNDPDWTNRRVTAQ